MKRRNTGHNVFHVYQGNTARGKVRLNRKPNTKVRTFPIGYNGESPDLDAITVAHYAEKIGVVKRHVAKTRHETPRASQSTAAQKAPETAAAKYPVHILTN